MYDIAVALSVVLSFGLYEGFGLLTGGMVSAGYLCLFLEEPLRIVTTLLLAVIVHGLVLKFGGSISAEHGIGQLKRDELAAIRPAIEIDLMRRIKQAFDPAGIMNPGKVIG